MRNFLLITLNILLFLPLFSQNTDNLETYPMVAYWNKNEILKYDLVCGKKKYVADKLKDSSAIASKMTLTIVDSTDKRYLISIAYDSDRFTQDLGFKSKEADQVINKFKAQKFRYETSETGEFKEFKDLMALKNFYKDIFKLMEKDERFKSLPKENLDNLKTMLTSDDYIASKSFEEILLMHSFYGKDWPVDTTMTFEDQLPNSFNPKETFPATSTFLFQYDEEDPEIGYIFYNTTVKEEALSSITKNMLLKLGGEVGKNANKINELKMTMEDTNTYVIEVNTGTILSFYRERIVTADDVQNVTFTELNLR
jgi:hypothetical protein